MASPEKRLELNPFNFHHGEREGGGRGERGEREKISKSSEIHP